MQKSSTINQLIYELDKGIRKLILYTFTDENAIQQIIKSKYAMYVQYLEKGNINVFFGQPYCVEIVKLICKDKKLNELSCEEEFMLGLMLGYDIEVQCKRYLCRTMK